jgi:hypothetical protein
MEDLKTNATVPTTASGAAQPTRVLYDPLVPIDPRAVPRCLRADAQWRRATGERTRHLLELARDVGRAIPAIAGSRPRSSRSGA